FFHRFRDFHRVRAVLAGHGHQDARFAHDQGVPELRFRRFDDVRHVFQAHAAAVMLRHDHFAELWRRERLAFGLNQDALRRGFNEARAPHTGCFARGVQYVLEREVEGEQPVWPRLNLELPDLAAEDRDLGDTWNSEQPRA